jgi:hypothetical protein
MRLKIKHAVCVIACWIAPPLLAQSETTKYPTWLIGLDVEATPNKPFTESLMDFYLNYNEFKARTTLTQDDSKTFAAENSSDVKLGLDYMNLIQNGRICLGFGAALEADTKNIDYYSPAKPRSEADLYLVNGGAAPMSGAISIKPQTGLWVGMRHEWIPEKRDYVQSGATSPDTSQSTEYNKKTFGLQFLNYPVQAALEYSLTNKSDLVETDLKFPIRLAVSEKLFIGTKLNVKDSEFINANLHEATSGSAAEVGYQGESSAYAFKFEYDINKSGLASSVTLTKTKTGYFEAAFGKPQGLRYRLLTGYAYELSRNSSSLRGRKEGGIFKIDISRAQ